VTRVCLEITESLSDGLVSLRQSGVALQFTQGWPWPLPSKLPADKKEKATQTVLEQTEALSEAWVAA